MFNNRLHRYSQVKIAEYLDEQLDEYLQEENQLSEPSEESNDDQAFKENLVKQIHDIAKDLPNFSLDLIRGLRARFDDTFYDYVGKYASDPTIRRQIKNSKPIQGVTRNLRKFINDYGLQNIKLSMNLTASELKDKFTTIMQLFSEFKSLSDGWGLYNSYYWQNNVVAPEDSEGQSKLEELKNLITEFMLGNSGKNRFYMGKLFSWRDSYKFSTLPFVKEFIKRHNIYNELDVVRYFESIYKEFRNESELSLEELSQKATRIIINYIESDVSKYDKIIEALKGPRIFYELLRDSDFEDLAREFNRNWIWDTEALKDFFPIIRNSVVSHFGLDSSNNKNIKSKHFGDFDLPNSSNEERKLFDKLEKLGLYAIPAKQTGIINLIDDEGQKFGFRIDFLLPCNIREYDGENSTLRNDIVFVGEYFGYYGSDYEMKKQRKIQWQNNLESSLDQRCLHIEPGSNLCNVLNEKNIDSKCYSDFGGKLFNVNNDNDKKTFYVKSQMQHFLYQYLVNELLWEINYDYNLNTLNNYNQVKENNGVFLDRFEKLLLDVEKSSPQYLVVECAKIVDNYKKSFERKRLRRNRQRRLSFVYNHRKNPSN